jgi:hypothetical protein
MAEEKSPPPTQIPRMRFVRVVFATEGKQAQVMNREKTRPRSLFLVEESIEESREGRFRKYINNQAPVPNTFLFDCEDANRALFLAFTQHWQYKRTHGLAFVSDYQGEMYSNLMCLQATEDVFQEVILS